jgi:MoaA/NifB/PqqE/SkfB family radical SAM enzyme
MFEKLTGCAFPGRTLVIRPNGAVLPCPFWEDDPIAIVPHCGRRAIFESIRLQKIRTGLRTGCPIGTCRSCSTMKDAYFRPLPGTRESLVEPS